MSDRDYSAAWARRMLSQTDVLILDTETTGLHGNAEIVQIAIIDCAGKVLLDTLIKPTCPIPRDASGIHGITDDRVKDAPTFVDIAPKLRELLSGATVVIYNADFDTRILEQSAQAHQLTYEVPIFGAFSYECAMEMYSQWYGDWSSYHHSYRWQRLPGGDHSALGDARATLDVIKKMAGEPKKMATPQTITWFADSPDAGHPSCICSWCGTGIGEHDAPPIRLLHDTENKEARFHRRCASEAGILGGSFPEDELTAGFDGMEQGDA